MAYEQKTWPTSQAVADYIASLPTERRQREARVLVDVFEEITDWPATMWGPSIIGFGSYKYQYASGHKGEAARTGFSPRKAALTFYLLMYDDQLGGILPRLGKYKASKGCVYVNKLEDIDLDVLREAIRYSVEEMERLYPQAEQP